MNFKKFTICLFIAIFSFANAQKLELGKVSIQELSEKQHPIDSAAVAAILFNKSKTYYTYLKEGFYMEHEYSFRIKIYKKEGLNWATKKVNNYIAYSNINNDYVNFFDCVTYNLVDNKIERTKLKSEGNFTTKLNKYYNQTIITMPNVRVGSVIEYKYVIKSEYFTRFPDFDFQETIPVNYVEYKTEIPELFIYKQVIKGVHEIKTEAELGFGYQNYADNYNQGLRMEYKQINTVHTGVNIPALKNEDYIDNIENYRASISYELDKTRFPNVPVKNYAETWNDVAKDIYEDKRFGKEIQKHEYHSYASSLILKDKTDELDKLNTIFRFVQNKMNWNGEHAIFAEKSVDKAFIEEAGNAAQINFILISMLNHAGFNANPVLISTKQNGLQVYPNRSGFDFVIAAVEIEGKQILMDATNKFSSLNILPIRNLNWTGRLIRQDSSSEEINLIPNLPSIEKINLKIVVDEKGTISGKSQISKTDYNAMNFQQSFVNFKVENYIDNLENNLNNLKINDFKIENNKNDYAKPIVQTFSFASNKEIEIINNKFYFSPLFFYVQKNNPFKLETRYNPIDFEFPKEKFFSVSIEIPEGYEIETLPKSINISTGENVADFKYLIEKNNNKIQLVVNFNINKTLISQDFYDVLKDFYKQMIEKENEKIVLKKI